MATIAAPTTAPRRVTTPPAGAPLARLESVDLLRGLVMVLMALDHVRDFFGDFVTNPTDLSKASTALFVTRWVTHFCAPTFFFLAGTGAFLSLRKRTRAELSRWLLVRGLILVGLEVTLLRFLWQFNLDYRVTILNVIWALALSMIALAGLVRLRTGAVAAIGLGMIALHNLLDGVAPAAFGTLAPMWNVLHQPGVLAASPDRMLFLAYPLIPWIGVMAAGFALGAVYAWEAERRRAFLLRAGLACIAAFVVLRATNAYGDPRPWSVQESAVRTLLSFVNTSKYPPSLLFLLMTLGPGLLVLRAFDGGVPRSLRPALVFGRTPLFYFALHVLVIHLLAIVASLVRYGTAAGMASSPTLDRFPITQPPGWPVSLPATYALWALVVVLSWPVCRWYARLRERRRDLAWLGYF
jgi:uncharacterized membrane protein